QPSGAFLLPSNQLLKPWGELRALRGRPVDAVFDSQKRLLAVLNSRAVELLDGSTGVSFGEVKMRSSSYTGVAFLPGDREIWASETTRNGPDAIVIGKLSAAGKLEGTERIDLKGHPLPAGIAFSSDGKFAYVAFSRSNSLAVFDTASRVLVKE